MSGARFAFETLAQRKIIFDIFLSVAPVMAQRLFEFQMKLPLKYMILSLFHQSEMWEFMLNANKLRACAIAL